MRLAVRYQLSILLVLASSVGLAVLALSFWYVNYDYVLNVAADNLETAAALKARELSVALDLMYTSCLYLTAIGSLQQALQRYNDGSNRSSENWDLARADVTAALSDVGLLRHAPAAQTQVYSRNPAGPAGTGSVLNITGIGYDQIELPYRNRDGTQAYLGNGPLGDPPALYPNLTIKKAKEGTSAGSYVATYDGITLGSSNSELVLGPLIVNESFSLISMTLPVIENNSESNVLGWMTIVQDSRKIQVKIVLDRVGLGKTGINILFGPVNKTNRFPSKLFEADKSSQASLSSARDVRFLFPVEGSASFRHPLHAFGSKNRPFRPSRYPAVQTALAHGFDGGAVVGSKMRTHDEGGHKVSVAYAIPATRLVDWIVIVEKTRRDVWQPIRRLRDIILACFWSVFGFFLLASLPIAHWAVRPIKRLNDATRTSIDPLYSGSKDSLPPTNGGSPSAQDNTRKANRFIKMLTFWRRNDVDHSAATDVQEKRFRIPSKVDTSGHWIKDDLSDLSETFNEMVDELYVQYSKLEERIRERTAELEKSKQDAEAANESKTMFVANVSHELKTPLNGILGMCAISIEDDDVQQMKTAMSIIYKSGDMLLRTLNDLLTFSTNQVGAQELSLEEREFIPQDLEFQVLAIFNKTAEEKTVKLSVEYEDAYISNLGASATPARLSDMNLWGDVHRILQIVINLVSNSLKYTPANGFVTVVIRRSAEPAPSRPLPLDQRSLQSYKRRASVMMTGDKRGTANWINPNDTATIETTSLAPSGTEYYFEFEVKDSGQGIPENMQSRIFEPFVQGETGLDRKHSGTGLGLSICSQLAQLMRGSITVESAVGEGSKFTVKIPLRHVMATPSSRTARTSSEIGAPVSRVTSATPTTRVPASVEEPSTDSTPRPANPRLRQVDTTPPKAASSKPPEPTQQTAAKKTRKATKETEQHDFSKTRILVAEDNKVNQQVVLRMLKLEQVLQVTIAEDGEKALHSVKTNSSSAEDTPDSSAYDLILMDIQMPNMDGLASTRLIREAGYKMPIVALTAFAEQSNIDDCYKSGMDHFLAKPLQRPQLRDVLIKFCSSSSGSELKTEQ